MRPDGVVIVLPDRQGRAHVDERGEDGLVEQLVTQASVEAFDEGILLRFAWRDESIQPAWPVTNAGLPFQSVRCRCRKHTSRVDRER